MVNLIEVDANNASIGGGSNNIVTGVEGTVPGGGANLAGGFASFAAGEGAQALNDGTFVWSDGSLGNFTSTGNNQFLIRASGGMGIDTASPRAPLDVVGEQTGGGGVNFNSPVAFIQNQDATANSAPALRVVANGSPKYGALCVSTSVGFTSGSDTNKTPVLIADFGNADQFVSSLDANGNWTATSFTGVIFNQSSYRNVKENFSAISPRDVLDEVNALPISRWNYKTDKINEHIGPMAQDFYSAFNVGTDDKHISTVDEGGVALAAIQGLNDELEGTSQRSEGEIKELKAENEQLKSQLEELKQLMKQLNQKLSGGE